MKNRVCELLGIEYPIIQGAMAWVADASLATAVSQAGGLGLIASGNAPVDVVREQIRLTRAALNGKPFGVNIMLMSPLADDIAQLVCDESVPVVTTGAGSPKKYMELWMSKGIKVIPVVPSVALAKRMENSGAHAVVAEGMEAGGHIGKLTTMSMIPQVVDAVSIPVIAAGGIADGRGMAAALMLGACGVQVGTRFLTAFECNIHENYKKMVLKANDLSTAVTGEITGHPVRALRSALTREYVRVEKEEAQKETPDVARVEAMGAGGLRKAVQDGDLESGSFMAGQIAGLVNKEQSCADILKELMTGCKETINAVSAGIVFSV